MATGFNQVILLGNLVRDPELRRTGGGVAVCNLRLAVDDVRRNRAGEPVTETLFIDAVVAGPQAEAANAALSKGSRVFLQGRLQMNEWTGRDGARHTAPRVAAQRIDFLDAHRAAPQEPASAPGAPGAAPAPAPGAPAGAKPAAAAEKPGDLPF